MQTRRRGSSCALLWSQMLKKSLAHPLTTNGRSHESRQTLQRVMLRTALTVCLTGVLAAYGGETARLAASPVAPSAQALTAHTPNAAAYRFRWARVAIGGGGFNTGVYVHPRLPDTVYSRIDVGGLYRWDETRARWFQTMDWMPTDFNATKGVDGVAIDPGAGREKAIYAALGQYPYTVTTSAQGNGLWRSLDGGRTWTKIFGMELPGGLALFGSNMADRMYGERIAIDPNNSRVVYAGTRTAGLYRSVNALDASPAFQKVASVPDGVQRFGPNVILLDPRAGTTGQGAQQRSRLIYAGYSCNREDCAAGGPLVFEGGVYRSQDGGETFSRIGGAGAPAVVKRMALGADGSLLVVPNEGNGILKWDGASWSALSGTGGAPFNALATDAADPRRLVAWSNPGFYGDLWRSTDAGQTWSVVSVNNGKLDLAAVNWLNGGFALNVSAHVVFDPLHRNRIYWAEPYATYRADDVFADKVTAQPLLEGSETTVNFAMAAPPAPSNGAGQSKVQLYGAFADVRGFRFSSLKKMPPSLIFPTNGGGMLSDVVSAPSDPRSVIVSQPTDTGSDGTFPDELPRLKLSQDDGVTWLEKTGPPIDPRSSDANKSAGPAKIAISATDKRRIVYFGSRRMPHFASNAFSTETLNWQAGNGIAWDALPSYYEYDNSLVRLKADAIDGMRFYLLVGSNDYSKPTQVYVSQDGGANWRVPDLQNLPLAGFPALRHMAPVKTRSDPTPVDGELWVSLGNNGVWRSTDGGSQFFRVNPGALVDVRGIAFGKPAGANAEPTLFVAGKVKIDGATEDGVFLSRDLGQTFVHMTPCERLYVGGQPIRDMVGDHHVFGRVYIGLDGTGIIYSELKNP
jgi:xyloglucan-specific exo-beta-1,4-glucanase